MSGVGCKVSWMNVHDNRSMGIVAGGDNSVVEDSIVWQNCQHNNQPDLPLNSTNRGWANGLAVTRGGHNASEITHNAAVRRCKIYNNWGEGLDIYEADGIVAEDNIIYDNWSVNFYISDARNVLAQRNIVYTSTNSPLSSTTTTISMGDERWWKPRSANNTVINNFFYGTRFQVFAWTLVTNSGLDNVLIANNTLVNSSLEIGAWGIISNKSATIRNNIFYSDTGNPWSPPNDVSRLTFSNNLWSTTPPASLFGGASDVIGNPQLARTGSPASGLLSANYFKLMAASPAINKAAVIAGITNDFFLTSRGALPDIGGHEANSFPSPWASQDVGAVAVPGGANYFGTTFTVVGSGADIWNTADEFRYVYQPSSGNCSMQARVATQQNTDGWAKAGVMIRESITPGSRFAAVFMTPNNGVTFQWRASTDGSATAVTVGGVTAPRYVRIVRGTSNLFSAYYSSNGSSWTQIGANQTINMASTATIGLTVTSHNDGVLSTATFDTVTATP